MSAELIEQDLFGMRLPRQSRSFGATYAIGSSAGSSLPVREPIGPYYADFVCRDRRLVIEVDGGQHAERATDRSRDRDLNALGYRVVRVWNNEVIENLNGGLQYLLSELRK